MIGFPFLPEALPILIMVMSAIPGANTPGDSHGGQFVTREISTDHGQRRYKLFIPGSYNGSTALPLVVMLHGCTQDPDDIARGTRMNELAEEKSVLVAYPEQPESANPKKCWNWYDPAHQKRDQGEPALISAITRQIMASHRVDVDRVYVGGLSAGGAMAVAVALSYPDLYAAVGTHSGIPYGAAKTVVEALAAMQGKGGEAAALSSAASAAMGKRARAMPGIVFQGGADAVVNSRNAEQLALQLSALQGQKPGQKTIAPTEESGVSAEGYHYRQVTHGNGDGTVELWMVQELGHAWSGGSPEGTFTDSRGPNATNEMLRFFLAHPRASRQTND
ncbi:MAG: PHB depolymerase family esterase [Gemmatimonadota bacterium]|nr:PHB depolymerase family esterase [Gemmatimonadota bacterium]